MSLQSELHAFADRIADEFDALRAQPGVEFRTKGPRAPGISRKLHNDVCRSGVVSGAHRDGREWVCSRESWFTARRTKAPVTAVTAPANDATPVIDVDAMIRSAGYRFTRGER